MISPKWIIVFLAPTTAFDGTKVKETVSAPMKQSSRSLQMDGPSSAFELLSTSNGKTVEVRVNSSFVGECPEGSKDNAPFLNFFFATYKDPDSGEEVCDFDRDVDTCFSKTLTLGCDPETNKAKISLYARAPSLSSEERVDNPQVGQWCFPQDSETIGNARMVEETFDCWVQCDQQTACPGEMYCDFWQYPAPDPKNSESEDTSRFCLRLLEEGEECGFPFPTDVPLSNYCGPKLFCGADDWCLQDVQDNIPSVCKAYGENCDQLNDERCTTNEYCKIGVQKCVPRIEEDMCCTFDEQCQMGHKCQASTIDGVPMDLCRGPCTQDSDCYHGEGEVCPDEDPTNPEMLRYCTLPTDIEQR